MTSGVCRNITFLRHGIEEVAGSNPAGSTIGSVWYLLRQKAG